MRLVHLADYGGPYAGSFVPMVAAVLTAGRRRGFEPLAVFTDVARGRPWLQELDAAQIPYRLSARDEIGATVAGLAATAPCVLHSHFSSFDVACARAARRQGATTFWHIHSPLSGAVKPWVRNAVRFGLLSGGVREIFCVAPQIERDVRRRFGPSGRVSFMPNAIDVDRFTLHGDGDRRAARVRLGLPADGTLLMHFGWDWERKGGDVYLRAVKKLRDAGRSVLAVTVGAGEQAHRTATELGVGDAVRTLAPTDDVQALYAAADVLVMPSLAEGMPFSMAEALACERPVVATDAAGEREIGAGLAACRLTTVEPGAVADAVTAILDRDAAAVQRDALAARHSIRERMALTAWSSRLIERYESALGDAAAG